MCLTKFVNFLDNKKLPAYFLIVFILSFIIAGFVDNFINERTFQTFTSKKLQTFPISVYFIFYQTIFIAAGCLIIYTLRKKVVDLLLLPAWLVGFDALSLIFNGKQIFWQMNWRKEIWGSDIGLIGEPLFGIPIGYWVSFCFLIVYLLIIHRFCIPKKLK